MESGMIELSKYRYERSKEAFADAAEEQLIKASTVMEMILPYLEGKWE